MYFNPVSSNVNCDERNHGQVGGVCSLHVTQWQSIRQSFSAYDTDTGFYYRLFHSLNALLLW